MSTATVVERLLDARYEYLRAHPGQMPNRARLSPTAASELRAWVDRIENDPLLGRPLTTGLSRHAFGVEIFEDPTVQDIVVDEVAA